MPTLITTSCIAPAIHRLEIEAPRIARARQAGQFVIVCLGKGHERIPLTIAGSDPARGTITLIIQAVGVSTKALCALPAGAQIRDVVGPLGVATHLIERGHAVCVGGGVGTAVVLPIAAALKQRGVRVTSITGGRTKDHIMLEDDLRACGEVLLTTNDGSRGRTGFVTDALKDLLTAGGVDIVYAVGPVPMMKAVAAMTRPFNVHTVVSLNPVMIDGTGMCGGCRVTVGGKVRFACVDGPEFDGHQVDFDALTNRQATYKALERDALTRYEDKCRIGVDGPCAAKAP